MRIEDIEFWDKHKVEPLHVLELWEEGYLHPLKYIEYWEHQYLEQLYYTLKFEMQRMIKSLMSKEKIRSDWENFMPNKISEDAIGSERIFYWLFNQLGVPNSSPIGSDLFFETHNAFIHIDIKSVYGESNINDIKNSHSIGRNQNSYNGAILYKNKSFKEFYRPHLPSVYSKKENINGKSVITKKITLSYFIVIVNSEKEKNIQTIILTCVPNGNLVQYYDEGIKVSNNNEKLSLLQPGKKYGEARFRYMLYNKFDLLENKPYRIKVLYWADDIKPVIAEKLNKLKQIYDKQKIFY